MPHGTYAPRNLTLLTSWMPQSPNADSSWTLLIGGRYLKLGRLLKRGSLKMLSNALTWVENCAGFLMGLGSLIWNVTVDGPAAKPSSSKNGSTVDKTRSLLKLSAEAPNNSLT